MTVKQFIESLPEDKKITPARVGQLIKNLVVDIDYTVSRSTNNRFMYDLLPSGVKKLLERNTAHYTEGQRKLKPKQVEEPKRPVGRPRGKPQLITGDFIRDEMLRDRDKIL